MSTEEYTIVVSGQQFTLTRDQLESEPGNYFASYFLGRFQEASNNTREMKLQKDPLLFKFIQAHLRGYDPFPIPESFVPSYMTKEGALKNLLKDAQFFRLARLEELTWKEINKRVIDGPAGEIIYQYWVSQL